MRNSRELSQIGFAMVAASLSGDVEGRNTLGRDLTGEEARRVAVGLSNSVAEVISMSVDRGWALEDARRLLLGDSEDHGKDL